MQIECLDNPNKDTVDVLLITVPWTDSSMPLMAPAVLLPVIESTGATAKCVDLNIEVYNMVKDHEHKDALVRFFFDEVIDPDIEEWVLDMLTSIATQIMSYQPKYVGLSLFSYVCQHTAKWLSYVIKKIDPNVKIVIGGAGCLTTFTGPSEFAQDCIQQGIVDYHLRGDGEQAFYELLTGNADYPGINSLEWKELDREALAKLPIPDYRHYNFDLYQQRSLPLVGSRGCVRQCKFCDYIANWKKFQWRNADDIFNEMYYQYKKYKIRDFKFQDSLTNGNMKEFLRLTELLAEHNQTNPDEKFTWSGYFIFRNPTTNSDYEWEMIKASGAKVLVVGIENLNEHIRYHIGKKFSNEAIDYHLEQAYKHNITIQVLNIVGYINETQADIDFAKKWLDEHTKYKDMMYLQWGGTLGIFPNTWLERNINDLGIIQTDKHPQSWVNESIGSTPSVRANWVKDLNQYSSNLGYTVADNIDNHFLLEILMNA
jgi:hypothetical protein